MLENLVTLKVSMQKNTKGDCITIFKAGIKAVDPYQAVKDHFRLDGGYLLVADQKYKLADFDHIYAIGAGKASASMALALEEIMGNRLHGGLVVVKYGHLSNLKKVSIVEAGHPVPDEAGFQGAEALSKLVRSGSGKDLFICLISGGGSALLPLPVPEIDLKEKQETTRLLLSCGATIHEINTIRKHLSRIKGGGLARAAYPSTLISLILSDVIGNDFDVIASGPTVADKSKFDDCITIMERYNLFTKIPDTVRIHLQEGARGEREETPKPGNPIFKRTSNVIIGSNIQALEAAEEKARTLGYNTLIISSFIEGETREVSRFHAAILKEIIKSGRPVLLPACIISGGETTVTIKGNGKGGRNQEFALSGGIEIAGWKGASIFSAGTDGTDGPTDAAGAYADWKMFDKAQKFGLDPYLYLDNNDSYNFFKRMDDLIITGPTNTNVMDFRLMIAK